MPVIRILLDTGGEATVRGTVLSVDGIPQSDKPQNDLTDRMVLCEKHLAFLMAQFSFEGVDDVPSQPA